MHLDGYTKETFDGKAQDAFKEAVAGQAGVGVDQVDIQGVEEAKESKAAEGCTVHVEFCIQSPRQALERIRKLLTGTPDEGAYKSKGLSALRGLKLTGLSFSVKRDTKEQAPKGTEIVFLSTNSAAWEQDDARTSCAECDRPFGMLNRRHHCRVCGFLKCDSCTNRRVMGSTFAEKRICEPCYRKIRPKSKSDARKVFLNVIK